MIKLRKATIEDMMLIFEWANDPDVRASSFDSKPIPLENHRKWYEKVLENSEILFYILCDGNEDIGQIRLAIEGEKAVISYMIAKEKRGKGYGKKIIELAQTEIKEKRADVIYLAAEVKKENEASAKVFEKCGFVRTDADDKFSFCKRIQ